MLPYRVSYVCVLTQSSSEHRGTAFLARHCCLLYFFLLGCRPSWFCCFSLTHTADRQTQTQTWLWVGSPSTELQFKHRAAKIQHVCILSLPWSLDCFQWYHLIKLSPAFVLKLPLIKALLPTGQTERTLYVELSILIQSNQTKMQEHVWKVKKNLLFVIVRPYLHNEDIVTNEDLHV